MGVGAGLSTQHESVVGRRLTEAVTGGTAQNATKDPRCPAARLRASSSSDALEIFVRNGF
jgi:hypothetical protein